MRSYMDIPKSSAAPQSKADTVAEWGCMLMLLTVFGCIVSVPVLVVIALVKYVLG